MLELTDKERELIDIHIFGHIYGQFKYGNVLRPAALTELQALATKLGLSNLGEFLVSIKGLSTVAAIDYDDDENGGIH